jgi:hypothetical protein
MRKAAILSVGLVLGLSRIATASPNYAIIGAALGAGAGFAVANNVEGVSKYVAVPVLAVVGGVIGNQVSQRVKQHRGDSYDYGASAPMPKPVLDVKVADPHPGVDLIKISIMNANGVRTDVPILRIKDKFVGPQGESYDALPSSELLAQRYGM